MNKEELKQKRKALYQEAKAKRDADPHYQALKEKAKADRKAQYQAYKEAQKQAKLEAKKKKISERDKELMEMVMKGKEWEGKHAIQNTILG